MVTNRRGEDVASSSRGGGDVASSSRGGGDVASSSNTAEEGPMFWTRDLDRHYLGSLSTAVMQANRNLEDYSHVEVGNRSTFVGVYNGHGPSGEAAEHVRDKFTEYLMERVTDTSTMSGDVLRYAFDRSEHSWLDIVNTRFARDPYVAARGTCCLVGVFWRGNLHIANVGDSRAILGREEKGSNKIVVQQLTRDDNVRVPEVRAELISEHEDEPDFIVEDEKAKGVFRIKGRIQVSKSIGDAYLKIPRFNLDRVDDKFVLNSPVREGKPAISAVPITSTRPIEPQDRFVIFASDGLWDLMSNQEVADFVHENPNEGIAERLITHSSKLAVNARGSSCEDMSDITVAVVFFDHTLQLLEVEFTKKSITKGPISIKGDSRFTEVLDVVGLSSPNSRTVWVTKLPYGTTRNELCSLIRNTTGGTVQKMDLDPYGFSVSITFYEQQNAMNFLTFHKGKLMLKGRWCCVCLKGELGYCRFFYMMDRLITKMSLPYTLYIGGLADDETAERLSLFFTSRGIQIRGEPLIQVSRKGHLYAFVTFSTLEGTYQALLLNGIQHRGIPIRIDYRRDPEVHFRQQDLVPDFI